MADIGKKIKEMGLDKSNYAAEGRIQMCRHKRSIIIGVLVFLVMLVQVTEIEAGDCGLPVPCTTELNSPSTGLDIVNWGDGVGINAYSQNNDAITAKSSSSAKSGVYGENTTSTGFGVFGAGWWGGYGVFGKSPEYGVGGEGDKIGVYGVSGGTSGKGVRGWATADTGYTYGGYFTSKSTSGKGVYGLASSTTGVNYGVYGKTNSPGGYGVYSKGKMKVEGNQTVTGNQIVRGTKSAVVKLKNGESVALYAVEASENWFEDFGLSALKKGRALVKIDSTFAETVNTEMDYHVFLTPNGNCKGLYVTNKKGASFEVRELNGGKSDIPFSYRIVAKRKGYEDKRLAKINEDEMATMTTAEGEDMQKGEAIELASHVK